MASFDYITSKEFRESLEADHREMRKCFDVEAWKSVQVLAGSIVESLLIDYLSLPTNPPRSGKDPLRLDLTEAIAICRAEKALSDRTADLCSVIKSYRNLIHPGRMFRLEEPSPDKQSASVAVSLVEMIVDELAKVRRQAVGLTAEQILSKVLRDENSLPLLKHLMHEVSEQQRERLLLDLIPVAHDDARKAQAAAEDPWVLLDDVAERLESAYRAVLESVTTDARKRVAAEFVRVLREEDGPEVIRYGAAFFRPPDLEYVATQHQAMVREHLLNQVPTTHSPSSLMHIDGIGPFLVPADVGKFIDPFVRTLVSSTVTPRVKAMARGQLLETITTDPIETVIDERLVAWIKRYESSDAQENADLLKSLKKDIRVERIPF